MNKFAYQANRSYPLITILLTFTIYVVIFAMYHDRLGLGIAALATIPVIGAGWYFGTTGGMLTAILAILANVAILAAQGYPAGIVLRDPGNLIRAFTLILIGLVIGRLGTVTRERSEAIARLEKYEREHKAHTNFLELLSAITAMALEADSLKPTLNILAERIGKLFGADDAFFSLWDETKRAPLPTAAYGSLSDIYPHLRFEPGERTLTSSVLESRRPLAITDTFSSPYMSPEVAAIFPCHAMLGIPLIVQERNLGALLLGYKEIRSFSQNDLLHAELTAEQVAQVLLKSLLLEEERKQVKQLTTLHDVALIAIEMDNEHELISRVTDVIGKNLFTDNFGILLLDEQAGILRAHPSYRFFSAEEHNTMDMPLDAGITGQVARTGTAVRLGNVGRAQEYVDVDERTVSELCVPIKFKERILGVINVESTKPDAFTEDDERLLITLAGQVATALEQIYRAQAERKWLDQLAHSNELIYALAQITTHIEKAFSIDDILQNLGMELSKINLTCILAAFDKERNLFNVNYTALGHHLLETVENSLRYPLREHSFRREKLDHGNLLHPIVLSDPVDEMQMLFAHTHRRDILEVLQGIGISLETEPLRLPLTFEESLQGILWVWGKDLTKTDLPIMSIFAKQIGVSLERARLFQEVQSLALTDPLTGLQNRRSLFELGRVEFSRAHRMKREFSCMLLDLDHFKKINDTYGHLVGDQVLKEFAYRCKSSVREIDLVGRYGGEELIILLPETDRNLSVQVAERLRASIAATPISVSGQEIPLTVSIGVATKDENTLQLETLIARADQAMYIAKHKGRNRVAISK